MLGGGGGGGGSGGLSGGKGVVKEGSSGPRESFGGGFGVVGSGAEGPAAADVDSIDPAEMAVLNTLLKRGGGAGGGGGGSGRAGGRAGGGSGGSGGGAGSRDDPQADPQAEALRRTTAAANLGWFEAFVAPWRPALMDVGFKAAPGVDEKMSNSEVSTSKQTPPALSSPFSTLSSRLPLRFLLWADI